MIVVLLLIALLAVSCTRLVGLTVAPVERNSDGALVFSSGHHDFRLTGTSIR